MITIYIQFVKHFVTLLCMKEAIQINCFVFSVIVVTDNKNKPGSMH